MTVTHTEANQPDVEVAVIGSGFSGLCMGIKLREAGIHDFVILEKEAVFGGTWRANHYPGAACDVPVHLYSFSFAQNADWSRRFAQQPELLRYTESLLQRYDLGPHLKLDHGLQAATYDEAQGWWRLRTKHGELTARSVVSAIGPLSRASAPQLPGLAQFRGQTVHSSDWDHDYDLRGKRVAVIGTGASAIQFVPVIAAQVAQLDLYQRTPPWVLPRPDRPIGRGERWLLRHVAPLQQLYRGLTYVALEARYLAFARWPMLMRLVEAQARHHLKRQLPHDAALRDRLTPSYTAGCKRLLLSNDYYPALGRPNVALVTAPIAEVRASSVVSADGVERAVDAIIFGTGFDVEHTLGAIPVQGRGGRLLSEAAAGGLEAYKGATLEGFPNFYLIIGPNTGLGHNSMIYMIESAVRYVVGALQLRRREGLRTLEVKPEVCRQFNATVQQRLARTVWASGCKSWYLSSTGRNSTLWPGFTFQYRRLTRHFDRDAYRVE
ncbi:MAG: flavin-containing monooxygenase [Sphingomonadaceae bacterium]